MTTPAVGTPAAAPGTNGEPAPGAGQPPAGAPPQSAENQGNPAEPGKDGKEPAGGGGPQNPPGNGEEPNAQSSQAQQPQQPSAQEPRRLTQEEWQAQQADIRRQQEAKDWEEKAGKLVVEAPVQVRDMIDTLAEELDVRIPADLRKPILDLVNELATHGTKGGEIKWKGQHDELQETLKDTSLAFVSAMDDAQMRNKFADAVRGKDPKAWVGALIELKTPAIAAKALADAATAQAALLPEGEVRDGFSAKIKGENDPKKIAQAFHDALLGVVGPAGEPRVAARGGRTGKPTLEEVTRRRSAHEYKTDAEFLADQDLALQGT